jgi:hypothetical protein
MGEVAQDNARIALRQNSDGGDGASVGQKAGGRALISKVGVVQAAVICLS